MEKVCKDGRGPKQGTEIFSEEKKCQQSEWEVAVGKAGGKPGEWCVLEALRGAFRKRERALYKSS